MRTSKDHIEDIQHRVILTRGNSSTPHTLRCQHVNVGERTSGIRPAADGSWTQELEYRIQQSKEFGCFLSALSCKRSTKWKGYRTMISPALEYPLASTSFTRKECHQIQHTSLSAFCVKTQIRLYVVDNSCNTIVI